MSDATTTTLNPPPATTTTAPVKTRRLSLRARWTLTFLAGGALPLLLLGAATLVIQQRGLEHAEKVHEFAVCDHVADVIDGTLREAAEAIHRVGQVLTDPRIADEDAKLELAQETMANARSLAQVAIYLPDGARVDAIARRAGGEVPAAPERAPIAGIDPAGDGAWLPPEYGPHGALVRYLEPVRRDGALRAWVLATLRPAALSTFVHELSRDRFDNRADGVVVLDQAGRVLASGVASGPLAPGSPLLGRDLLASLRVTARDFRHDVSFSLEGRADGEAMVGTLRTVPTRGWAVLIRRPWRAVYGSLTSARRALGAVSALFLLVALGLSAVLVARTVRPIHALMRLARAFGQRRFDTPSTVRTGDELELLGNQMVDMARDIQRGEAEVARRATVESNLSRFIPAPVAQSIARGERPLALGGERRVVTVLFADVASFTPFAESAPPERVVAFLNELFGIMTEVVFRHEGTVDKFIGDAVMAVFGAPDEQPDHAARAVACADDLHRFVESSAERWKTRYGFEPQLAVGISTGEALVGNLGSESRMEYTCVGDTVNVAARLEAVARPGQTLVTDAVVRAAGDGFDFVSLGAHPLRGKAQPVALHELVR